MENGKYIINITEFISIGTLQIVVYVNDDFLTCFDFFGISQTKNLFMNRFRKGSKNMTEENMNQKLSLEKYRRNKKKNISLKK